MQSLLEQAEGLQLQVASVLLRRIKNKENCQTQFSGSPADFQQNSSSSKSTSSSSNQRISNSVGGNDRVESSDSTEFRYKQSDEQQYYQRLESGPDLQSSFQIKGQLGNRTAPNSALNQLDWLIRGLPEAYDDEDTDMTGRPLDDLAVEKLIREGGLPPSQLVFPSLHAVGQQIMKRLQGAKCLVVTFNHVFVYSARYGVRRHCSRLLVRPPEGCRRSGNEPESIVLELPELLGRMAHKEEETVEVRGKSTAFSRGQGPSPSAEKSRFLRPKKRASVGVGPDAFFVGGADLQRTVQFPIEGLSDRVLQGWLQGGQGGSLRIELESHVTPPYKGVSVQPNAKGDKSKSEYQVFGYMNIPLGGLLGTEGLDAIVTCEFEADKNTMATVLGRQQLLPLSSRSTNQVALGPKLGKITCRLTVISDSNTATVNTTHGQRDCQIENALGTAYPSKRGSVEERSDRVYERGEVKDTPVWSKQNAVAAPSLLLPVPPIPPTASIPFPTPVPVPVSASVSVGTTDAVLSSRMPPVPTHPIRVDKGGDMEVHTGGGPYELGGDGMRIRGQVGPVPQDDPLHSAMSYVPSEAPRKLNTQQGPVGGGQRAVMGVVLKSLFGLDVGALQPKGPRLEGSAEGVVVCRAVVAYKLSTSEREEVRGPWIRTEDPTQSNGSSPDESTTLSMATSMCSEDERGMSQGQGREDGEEEDDLEYSIGRSRVHDVSLTAWKPPVFEVWAEWGVAGPAGAGRTRGQSDSVVVLSKRLLGLSRFPPNSVLDQMMGLAVTPLGVCPGVLGAKSSGRGFNGEEERREIALVAAVHLSQSRVQAERAMQHCLSPYSDWVEAPTTAASAAAVGAVSADQSKDPGPLRSIEIPAALKKAFIELERKRESAEDGDRGAGQGRKLSREMEQTADMERERFRDMEEEKERIGQKAKEEIKKQKKFNEFRMTERGRERGSDRMIGNKSRDERGWTEESIGNSDGAEDRIQDLSADSDLDRRPRNFLPKPLPLAPPLHPSLPSASSFPSTLSISRPITSDTHRITPCSDPLVVPPSKAGSGSHPPDRTAPPVVHILDITIEGAAEFLSDAGEELGLYGSLMGCFVLYTFPNLGGEGWGGEGQGKGGQKDTGAEKVANAVMKGREVSDSLKGSKGSVGEGSIERERRVNVEGDGGEGQEQRQGELSQLWWDVECPVLNGRVRHVFESRDEGQWDSEGRGDGEGECEGKGEGEGGILFHVICSDSEGLLPPKGTRETLASARLSHSMLKRALSYSATQTFSLPLQFHTHTQYQDINTGLSSHSSRTTLTPGFRGPILMNVAVSHHLQPVHLQSIDICSDPLAIISRAKTVRNTTSVRDTVGPIKIPLLPTPDQSDLAGDDLLSLTAYERLQRGLYSWGLRGPESARKQSTAAVVAPHNLEMKSNSNSKGKGKGESKGERESGQGIEDEETGVALRGEGTRDREREREREDERGALVHVTVGKITNWPPSSPLAPSDPGSFPSHTPVPPTSTPATGGGSSSLFCVVDCSHITSDEGVTLGLSKYGHARTGSFTTSLQPVVPRTASSDGGERARRDIVWEETADMYVRGAHVHPTQTSNQQSWSPGGKGSSAMVTEGGTSDREVERVGGDVGSERGVGRVDGDSSGRSALSCCRGASLIVTVYLRRQWLLSDCLSDPDTSSTSQQGSVNVLHIGDQVVGRAVVDLSILALGLTVVCGWYHLIDAAHTHTGQIFLSVSLPPVNVPTQTGRIFDANFGNIRDEQPYISAVGVGDVAGVRNIEGESRGINEKWEEERWKEEDQPDEEGREEWHEGEEEDREREDEEEEGREREDEEEEGEEYEVDLGLGGDLEYDMQRREMKRKSVIESIAEEEEEEEVEGEEEEEFMHSRDHGNGVDADQDVDDEMEKRVNEKEEVEKGENEGAEEEHIHIVEEDGRESVGEETCRVGESVGESVGGHRKGEGEVDREGEWRQHGRKDREILRAKRDAEEVDRSEVQCSERAHRHIQEGGGGAEGEGGGGGDGAVRGEQVQEQQEEQEYDLLGLSLASFPSTPERTLPGESVSGGAHPLSAGDQYKLDPFPDLCYMGSPVAAAAASAVIVDIVVSKERAGKGQTDAPADSDSDRANSSGSGNGSFNSSGSGSDCGSDSGSGRRRRSCGVDDSGVSLGVGRDGGYDSGVGLDGTSGDSRGEDWSLEEEEAGVIDGAETETEAETVERRDRSDGESGGEKEGVKENDRDGRDKERERRESGMGGVRRMTQYWDSKCAGDKEVQDDEEECNQSDSSHSSGDIRSKSLPCDTERDIDTSSGCEGEVKTRTRREDAEDEDVSVDLDIDVDIDINNAGDSSSVCDDSAHREKESEGYSDEEYSEDTDFLSKDDSPPRSITPGPYPHSPVSTAAPSPPYSPIDPTHTNAHPITHTNTHTSANDRADELTRSSGCDDVTMLSDSANRHSTPRPHPDPYPRPRPHPDSDLSISRDSPSHQYDTSSYAASCSTQSPHSSDGMYSLHSDVIVEGGEDEVRGTGRGYEQGRGAVEEESSSSDKYSADFDLEETEIETEKEDEEGEGEGEGDFSAEVSKEATSDHSDLHSHSKPDKHSPLQRHGPVPLAPSPPPQWDQGGGQGQGHVLGPIEGGRTAAADSDRIKRLVEEEVDRIVKERYGTWTQNSTPRVGCSPAGKEYTAFGIDSPESLFHVPYRSPIAYTVGAVGGVGERQGRNAVSVGDSGRDSRPYVRDPLTGNARSNRTAPRPPPSSGPSPVPGPGPGPRPISDVIARALSAVKRAQDSDASAADRSREKTRFPGRQRQFIDLETERVSKIMLRTMGRSDHT